MSAAEQIAWDDEAQKSPQAPPVKQPQVQWDEEATEPSVARKILTGAEDVGIGALKGAGHTLSGLSPLINKIPYVGETLAPSEGIKAWQHITEPHGTAQKTGYYGEQAGEFLLPSGVEEKGAASLAEHLPMLGRVAAPTARTVMPAITTGALNKLQGGSFSGGALMGAGTAGLGEAAKSVAPSIAESALGITRRMRGFGKTPGKAALEEIGGLAPGKIAENAEGKLAQLTRELESRANGSRVPASTRPALAVIDKEQIKAIKQNDKATYQMLHDLRQQLTKEFSTGQPLSRQVSASQLLDLKRGIGNLEKTWNPELRTGIKPTIRSVYNALDKELDRTVPGADNLNQRISSLIPVKQRAQSTERGAEIGQRIAHRVAAHTGALAGTGLGSYFGYRRGGPEGAVIGGTLGLAAPELLASPSWQMGAARTLYSPVLPRLSRGAATQLLRSEPAKEPDEE